MLFNSVEFLIFLPIVFVLYWFIFNKKLSWQNGLVLFASYFFYGWWSWKFMGLLILSTALDYAYGFWVASPNRKKAKLFLWLSIVNNLGILGVFKYYNFFAVQFQKGLDLLGLHTNPVLLQFALPIGISFYTFQGMSYVFDIYRGNQKPVRNFVDYAVFVSFFPLLVAGPIERANHLLPQIQKVRFFSYNQAVEGCRLILWGMFKKVVVADTLANTVDIIFTNYQDYSPAMLILGVVAFSFQIYGDFSGYSDIALGVAKLFGFELLSNFKFPYFSRDIAEFWRRWHISLSSWFRDYLYIPLGGSKKGKLVAIRNTFIIFIVSGFWHGASWNFIAWGFIHACGFLPLLLLNGNRKNVVNVVAQNRKVPNLIELWQMISTFVFISIAWIFFRFTDINVAVDFILTIFQTSFFNAVFYKIDFALLLSMLTIPPLLFLDWKFRLSERTLSFSKNTYLRRATYFFILIAVFFSFGGKQTFIYFQF
jgi:D-alanyl-lipoteichoic acid acyltransferase DltB (MBOAT superfamily)